MSFKMIVTDLDGTLLRDDKTVSERTLSVIKQCRAKGIKFVYATGRGYSAEALVPSELFDGFVRMNGATAYIDSALVYSRLIAPESVRKLLVAADREGVKISAEMGVKYYANFDATAKWPHVTGREIVDFTKLHTEAEKLIALAETPEIVECLRKHLPEELYIYTSRDDLAMIMHKEAIKSKAVAALAARWNIERADIAAFGDDFNDIDLLGYAGVGIAVANALDEVKAAARYVCGSNEDDGEAKWLEENVLSCV